MGGRGSSGGGARTSAGLLTSRIQSAQSMGASVWERGDRRRLYFNQAAEKIIGLDGNRLNGERVSNTTARQYREVLRGSYADLNTGNVHVNRSWGTRRTYADESELKLSDYLKKKRR